MGEMLPEHRQLMLFQYSDNNTISLVAAEPEKSKPSELTVNAVLDAVRRDDYVYEPLAEAGDSDRHDALLVVPIKSSQNRIDSVFVLRNAAMSPVQQNTAAKLVQWAAVQLHGNTDSPSHPSSLAGPDARLTQSLLSTLATHGTLSSLAFSLANTLASLCGCTRVSVGRHDHDGLKLIAMSGQSNVDDRRQIAQQLRAVMNDVLANGSMIYPDADNRAVSIACQVFYRSQGGHPLMAFKLGDSDDVQFILVLERDQGQRFMPAQVDAIEQSVKHVGALLAQTSRSELTMAKLAKLSLLAKKRELLQFTQWTGRQMLGAAASVALILSLIIPVTHRVSADAYIEASDRQVLVASQTGFIKSANARAGDVVEKGAVLATLDGAELQLEADKWRSEQSKNQQAYAQALAIHDRIELSRLRADRKRIDAELSLIEQRLNRSELRAPISGVLMAGDWTQALGAPVTAGDVLFEIASAEQYQLVIEVDEHDIAYIQPQQLAELRMTALPATVWRATLDDVMPVAVSEQGRSGFRVLAKIDGDASALRPGMQGVGKVHIGKRSLFWVYTHRLANRLRYMAWKLGLL